MSLDLQALETSFDAIAPRGDELMDEFYGRLFAAAPAVRPLFPADMRTQKTMLLGALETLVGGGSYANTLALGAEALPHISSPEGNGWYVLVKNIGGGGTITARAYALCSSP